MNTKPVPDFAPGSHPDIVARLRHAIEANETTRIALADGLAAVTNAINLHLAQIDAHLERLISDLERRAS